MFCRMRPLPNFRAPELPLRDGRLPGARARGPLLRTARRQQRTDRMTYRPRTLSVAPMMDWT